ncbi:acetyltransferase [Phlyctema vagabunda]|uniref:Acetyltransferase n=1 Tax=Phlyctema vagabunda TaxID=108571 RepID=A0ABR4P4N6_9HELO
MPRDLTQEDRPPTLTESPNSVSDSNPQDDLAEPENFGTSFVMIPPSQQQKARESTNLHPYVRPLTINDLDSVVALENAAFPDPRERASKEKLAYRLSRCGELCLGLFCTMLPDVESKAETLATGRPVESGRRNGAVSVLLAHVIAAKTSSLLVTDDSMDFPKDWATNTAASTVGHQEAGRTICLHSVGVLPSYQGRGLGRVILLSYMQQMNGAGIADRLALIAHDHLTGYYEKYGFTNRGPSKAQFGGGGWNDLVFDLKTLEARAIYG